MVSNGCVKDSIRRCEHQHTHLNMSANNTVLLSLTTEMIPVLFISWELYDLISRICYHVLYPCIGVIGILGNNINIVILTRQGFRKLFNIILLSLAVSDCLFLFGINNGPIQVYAEHQGYMFSETLNSICFVLFMICSCANDIGSFSSVIIPVLITGERILAICYPFKAYAILTPRCTVIVLSCLYVIVGICCLYEVLLSYQLTYFVIDGIVVGEMVITDMRVAHERSGVKQLVDQIGNYLTGVIPISLVTTGCIVIGLRIVQITNRRRQMSPSQVTSSTKHGITKTTKTLLKICLLYIVCYGSTFIASFILQSKLLEQQIPTESIIQRFQNVVLSLNCVGNFLIYLKGRHNIRKTSIKVRKKKKVTDK
ncbi:unnamed protein product [Candidula unifasciata]|uniref:G-protein coupled receptors family 1 profile domain-containing protein n=1 Tax=Candidula unifasciata TaxID=100452 RepID=A0A8S3ZNP7_9EUPU|nr:unnamed protein product [Candidula unifasciata]